MSLTTNRLNKRVERMVCSRQIEREKERGERERGEFAKKSLRERMERILGNEGGKRIIFSGWQKLIHRDDRPSKKAFPRKVRVRNSVNGGRAV